MASNVGQTEDQPTSEVKGSLARDMDYQRRCTPKLCTTGSMRGAKTCHRNEEKCSAFVVCTVPRCTAMRDRDTCVSDGVNVLCYSKPTVSWSPIRKMATFLHENCLCVVPADKESGFVILTEGQLNSNAEDAILSLFSQQQNFALSKIKTKVKKFRNKLHVEQLARKIHNSERDSLQVLITTKSHKVVCPLRVITSKSDSWQKTVAKFLQQKLSLLNINNHFLENNSESAVEYLAKHHQVHGRDVNRCKKCVLFLSS